MSRRQLAVDAPRADPPAAVGPDTHTAVVSRDAPEASEPRLASALAAVNRRRAELWTISTILVMTLTVAVALLSLGRDLLPEALRLRDLPSWIAAVLISGLTLAFLIYVWEKERNLRLVTRLLLEERVHSNALADRVSQMARLSEVGKAVNSAVEQREAFDTILSAAVELLGGTEGSIALVDDAGSSLHVVAYSGPQEAREGSTVPMGDGVMGSVAQRRRPLLIDAAAGNGGRPGSIMCVPLVRDGELLGALMISEEGGPRRFTEGDLDALGFFAEYAAIAIGNARLFQAERETVARLKELDQLKSDFVATVSHELRTPLSAIIGAAKTVARRGPSMDAVQHQNFMSVISRQADRLLRLVQDVLNASRMESARPRLQRDMVDLRSLLEDLIDDLSHAKLGVGRTIVLATEPERPRTWGDYVALEQVCTNLLENALKYSDGAVNVTVTETHAEVTIVVADAGRGIDPEQLGKIFERFGQVTPTLDRSAGGFGLGLFIVKNLVDAHNGCVEVESEVGVGTRFTVHLPRRTGDEERA